MGGVSSNSLLQANLIQESDVNQPIYSDDAAQINSSVFTNLYSQQTSIAGGGGGGTIKYDGIDMLLANNLNELNELSQFDEKKATPSKDNQTEQNCDTSNTKRKSIFSWGGSK